MDDKASVQPAELEQYRQAGEDLRQHTSLVWQHTIATVLTLILAGGAIIVRDVPSGLRAVVLYTVSLFLASMWHALLKHRFGTDTRTARIDHIERKWVEKGWVDLMTQRRTHPEPDDIRRTDYRPPKGFEVFSSVENLKRIVILYAAGLFLLASIYLGAEIGCWSLPQFLQVTSK